MRTKIVRSNTVAAIIALLAPELLVFTAIRDFQDAMQRRNELRKLVCHDFTRPHGFFFDMGGFCLKSSKRKYHQLQKEDIDWEKIESHRQTWISELSSISEDQINDFATSDTITKTLACLQALWLAIQVVSRLAQHQAVTLLEISTMAYVLCTLISYGFWWKKPQNCAIPFIITCADDAMKEMSQSVYEGCKGTLKETPCSGRAWIDQNGLKGIWRYSLLFVLAPFVFGAVYIVFWDITLPTAIELWLLQASGVGCMVIPVLIAILVYLPDATILNVRPSVVCVHILLLAYILFRIYTLVEGFLSLRALPSSAFDTVKWLSFVPHI